MIAGVVVCQLNLRKINMQYYCEMCDEYVLADRRKDNIYVCDKCNNKYPIERKEMRKEIQKDIKDPVNIKNENDFKLCIESKWGILLDRLPIVYGFDYACRKKDIIGWIELKNRRLNSYDFKDSMINLNKWIKAKELRDSTGIPTLLAVRYYDKDLYVKLIDDTPHTIRWGARTTKTRDWEDIGPAVHIPISEFKEIK